MQVDGSNISIFCPIADPFLDLVGSAFYGRDVQRLLELPANGITENVTFVRVKDYSLNPITNLMEVVSDPTAVSAQDIEKAVTKAGVKAVLVGHLA